MNQTYDCIVSRCEIDTELRTYDDRIFLNYEIEADNNDIKVIFLKAEKPLLPGTRLKITVNLEVCDEK